MIIQSEDALVRLKVVIERVGLSRSTIYRMMCCGDFPVAVQLSKHSVAWRLVEIEQWINDRPIRKGAAHG